MLILTKFYDNGTVGVFTSSPVTDFEDHPQGIFAGDEIYEFDFDQN